MSGFSSADLDELGMCPLPVALCASHVAGMFPDVTEYKVGSCLAVPVPGVSVKIEGVVGVCFGFRVVVLADVDMGKENHRVSLVQAVATPLSEIASLGSECPGNLVVALVMMGCGQPQQCAKFRRRVADLASQVERKAVLAKCLFSAVEKPVHRAQGVACDRLNVAVPNIGG
jgi:hypothetical protein